MFVLSDSKDKDDIVPDRLSNYISLTFGAPQPRLFFDLCSFSSSSFIVLTSPLPASSFFYLCLTSPSLHDLCLPSLYARSPSFASLHLIFFFKFALSNHSYGISPTPIPPPVQQPTGPARLLQAPAELLCHDITHPAAATAHAGAASGTGAARAA